MLSVAKRDVIDRSVDELMLDAFTFAFAHLREAERIVLLGVDVVGLIVMRGMCGRDEDGTLGNECAVVEGDVFHRLARDRG